MTSALNWGVAGLSDAELARAAAVGDRRAFAGIYDRYADRLHDFSVGMLRDRDAAADCVQDVFCKAATELANLREPDKLRPWLYSIARNQALRRINARRREQVFDEVPDAASSDADPATLAQRNELARLIDEAAGGLSDRDRSVLELSYRHGLEGQALADALGVSTNSANVMVFRLRETIERSLGALLVARQARHNPNACRELAAILAGWDGRFTILMRKRIARHIEACPTCDQDRRRLVNPKALLGAAPMFIPAPTWLRDHTLGRIQLTSASSSMSDTEGRADGSSHASPYRALTRPAPTKPAASSAETTYRKASATSEDPGGAIGWAGVDDREADARVKRRLVLLMALFVGLPLVALGLTIAWFYIPNVALSPSGLTTPAPAPASSKPSGQEAGNGGPPGQSGQPGQPGPGSAGQPGQSAGNGGPPGQSGQPGQPGPGSAGQPGQSAGNGGPPGQSGQPGQPGPGSAGQPGQSAGNGGPPGQSGQPGQPGPGSAGQPGQSAGNGGPPGQSGQPGQPGPGSAGQLGQSAGNGGPPGQSGQPGQPGPGSAGQPGQSAGNGGPPGQSGQPGQPGPGNGGPSAGNGGPPGQSGQSGQPGPGNGGPSAGNGGQPGQSGPGATTTTSACPPGYDLNFGKCTQAVH